MKLWKIDKMKSSKMKLYLWIKYASKYDCFEQMPEIMELYRALKQREEITQDELNRMLANEYLEVV